MAHGLPPSVASKAGSSKPTIRPMMLRGQLDFEREIHQVGLAAHNPQPSFFATRPIIGLVISDIEGSSHAVSRTSLHNLCSRPMARNCVVTPGGKETKRGEFLNSQQAVESTWSCQDFAAPDMSEIDISSYLPSTSALADDEGVLLSAWNRIAVSRLRNSIFGHHPFSCCRVHK